LFVCCRLRYANREAIDIPLVGAEAILIADIESIVDACAFVANKAAKVAVVANERPTIWKRRARVRGAFIVLPPRNGRRSSITPECSPRGLRLNRGAAQCRW
jgi:hypothetical protein